MWSTNDGPKDERTLRADADNQAFVVIRSARSTAFNLGGRPRPPVPIAQDVSYVADGELLAHQRVDSSRHLPAGRHQVVVIVTWERGQRASQAFDLTIPPTTSTRLNSSHDQISYAVFCLKKKTRPART